MQKTGAKVVNPALSPLPASDLGRSRDRQAEARTIPSPIRKNHALGCFCILHGAIASDKSIEFSRKDAEIGASCRASMFPSLKIEILLIRIKSIVQRLGISVLYLCARSYQDRIRIRSWDHAEECKGI